LNLIAGLLLVTAGILFGVQAAAGRRIRRLRAPVPVRGCADA